MNLTSGDFPPDSPEQDVSELPPVDAPSAASELPAPMRGCLYCHTEGSTSLSEGRKFLGFGSGLPVLTCSVCGAVALLEGADTTDPHRWRLRYRRFSREPRYYYAMVYLGSNRWLDADEALAISRRAYVQRRRVIQVEQGDLSWLAPLRLDPPPPLMSPDEEIFLTALGATFQQATRGGAILAHDEENVLDSGSLYVTNRKIHLLGRRRDWSHKLADIQSIEHTDRYWRVYVGGAPQQQHYQGINHPDHMDAQLFALIVRTLKATARPEAGAGIYRDQVPDTY